MFHFHAVDPYYNMTLEFDSDNIRDLYQFALRLNCEQYHDVCVYSNLTGEIVIDFPNEELYVSDIIQKEVA